MRRSKLISAAAACAVLASAGCSAPAGALPLFGNGGNGAAIASIPADAAPEDIVFGFLAQQGGIVGLVGVLGGVAVAVYRRKKAAPENEEKFAEPAKKKEGASGDDCGGF